MMDFKVDFDSMDWQTHREGARFKLFRQGAAGSAHKATWITPGTRLVMVEDI